MKVLYAENEEIIKEYVALLLEGELDLEVVEASNGQEAIEILNQDSKKEIGMVISDYHMPKQNGRDLYQYLVVNRPNTPFVLLSSTFPEELHDIFNKNEARALTYFLAKPFKESELIQIIHRSVPYQLQLKNSSYFKINSQRFLNFYKQYCDIYLRLSADKFVKIMGKDNQDGLETIQRYVEKKCDYFYVTPEDYSVFMDNFTQQVLSSLSSSDSKPAEEKVGTELAAIRLVHEKVQNLGLDKQVIELVENTSNSCLASLKKISSLAVLIEKISKGRNYLYEHSLLISYISCGIAAKLPWGQNRETFEKLCAAAILHDIALDRPELARMAEMHLPLVGPFQKADVEKFKKHPQDACSLIKDCRNIPLGTEQIILQHHELPNGTGFPHGRDWKQIGPLAGIFIIAESFAARIFEEDINIDKVKVILQDMAPLFQQGGFKKSFEALQESLSQQL